MMDSLEEEGVVKFLERKIGEETVFNTQEDRSSAPGIEPISSSISLTIEQAQNNSLNNSFSSDSINLNPMQPSVLSFPTTQGSLAPFREAIKKNPEAKSLSIQSGKGEITIVETSSLSKGILSRFRNLMKSDPDHQIVPVFRKRLEEEVGIKIAEVVLPKNDKLSLLNASTTRKVIEDADILQSDRYIQAILATEKIIEVAQTLEEVCKAEEQIKEIASVISKIGAASSTYASEVSSEASSLERSVPCSTAGQKNFSVRPIAATLASPIDRIKFLNEETDKMLQQESQLPRDKVNSLVMNSIEIIHQSKAAVEIAEKIKEEAKIYQSVSILERRQKPAEFFQRMDDCEKKYHEEIAAISE